MSMIGSVITILLFGITKIFDNKLSAKWKCFVLLVPILFLLVPMNRVQIRVNKEYSISTVMDKVETSLKGQDIQEEVGMNTKRKQELQKANLNNEQQKELDSIRIKELLAGVWLLGCMLGSSVFILQKVRLKYKTTQAQTMKEDRLSRVLQQCMLKLKLKRNIEIKLQDRNQSPCICDLFRPKILISREILKQEDSIIENVLMHELAHYKRKDMLTNYILLVTTILHWFNPFVYALFRKIRQEMELATDEVALSKMNQEKKKQYGFTLLSLLQTYEKERVEAKMLCMTDDSKNMERRIKKIKFSIKQKKYKVSILCFSIILIIAILLPFIIKTVNLDEEKLYQQVEQYLVALEEKRLAEGEKQEGINNNVETQPNVKTFVELKRLGVKRNKDEIYVYVWAMIENYYANENKEQILDSGSYIPYRFTIKEEQIINCEFPEDGEGYRESIKRLFPEELHEKLEEYAQGVEASEIERKVEEYYSKD